MRPRPTLYLLLVVSLVMFGCGPSGEFEIPRQIIFISIDTLRADMLNYDGYDEFETSPFLDTFAAENVVFERTIAQEPRTLTSHMSFFTGLLPQHHAVQDTAPLSSDVPTITSVLQAHGYLTQAFVDGGYLRKQFGFDRGFDNYDDFRSSGSRGLARVQPKALEWLRAHADNKFFLFLHTYDIHSKGPAPHYRSPDPYRGMFSGSFESDLFVDSKKKFVERWRLRGGVPSEADRRFLRATYAEGIRYVDDRLREFFAELKQMGIYEDALIVIWSDHGEGLYDHQGYSHGQLYDHTTRVPLIMKIPGLETGTRVRTLVSSVDLAPTILELVGLPDSIVGDGVSLLRFLDREDPERLAYSIRTKGNRRRFAVRSQTHHLLEDQRGGGEALFDLRVDPLELSNLMPEESPVQQSLRRRPSRFIEEYDLDMTLPSSEAPVDLESETLKQLRALGYVD